MSKSLVNIQKAPTRTRADEEALRDILPRLGLPAPTEKWYQDEFLKPQKNVTMKVFCQGFEINRMEYETWREFVQERLLDGHNFKLSMGSNAGVFVKGEIFRAGRKDLRFNFLNKDISPAWVTWALDGTANEVAQWLKDNDGNLNTPRRKRTYNYEDPDAIMPQQKTIKIAPENSELVVMFVKEDDRHDEVHVPVQSITRPDVNMLIGRKAKTFNYKSLAFTKFCKELERLEIGSVRGEDSDFILTRNTNGRERLVDSTDALEDAIRDLHGKGNEVHLCIRVRREDDV